MSSGKVILRRKFAPAKEVLKSISGCTEKFQNVLNFGGVDPSEYWQRLASEPLEDYIARVAPGMQLVPRQRAPRSSSIQEEFFRDLPRTASEFRDPTNICFGGPLDLQRCLVEYEGDENFYYRLTSDELENRGLTRHYSRSGYEGVFHDIRDRSFTFAYHRRSVRTQRGRFYVYALAGAPEEQLLVHIENYMHGV